MTRIKYESDLRGVGNLTIDAIIGITGLVEAMHHNIAGLGGILGGPDHNRDGGSAVDS
jgi:hypothetical protein